MTACVVHDLWLILTQSAYNMVNSKSAFSMEPVYLQAPKGNFPQYRSEWLQMQYGDSSSRNKKLPARAVALTKSKLGPSHVSIGILCFSANYLLSMLLSSLLFHCWEECKVPAQIINIPFVQVPKASIAFCHDLHLDFLGYTWESNLAPICSTPLLFAIRIYYIWCLLRCL